LRRGGARFEARFGLAESDHVAVLQLADALLLDTLFVDIGAIEAAEITQPEIRAALFDDAVLFRHDLVEELDRVARVPSKGIGLAELDDLLSLVSVKDEMRHDFDLSLAGVGRAHNVTFGWVVIWRF